MLYENYTNDRVILNFKKYLTQLSQSNEPLQFNTLLQFNCKISDSLNRDNIAD